MFENIDVVEFITILFICTSFYFYMKYMLYKKAIEKYYNLVKPDATNKEINDFVNKLSMIDEYNNLLTEYKKLFNEHLEAVDSFGEAIVDYVARFEEIFDTFHDLNEDMWNKNYRNNKEVKEVFDTYSERLSSAYSSFDDIFDEMNKILEAWEEEKRARKKSKV